MKTIIIIILIVLAVLCSTTYGIFGTLIFLGAAAGLGIPLWLLYRLLKKHN